MISLIKLGIKKVAAAFVFANGGRRTEKPVIHFVALTSVVAVAVVVVSSIKL